MHTIENIRGKKIVVQCKTQKEANRLLKAVDYYHSYNYSDCISSQWKRHRESSCYELSAAGVSGIGRDKQVYWVNLGYEVIQCAEVVTDDLIKEIDLRDCKGRVARADEWYKTAQKNFNAAKKEKEAANAEWARLNGVQL